MNYALRYHVLLRSLQRNENELVIMMRGLKNLRNALRKKVACVLLAGIACLSMSCTPQKSILVQQKTVPVPTAKIDTCFVFHRDTAFIIETDTFRIETIIRDTLITQHIETKPYYITTTDTIYINTPTQLQKTDKNDPKKEIKQTRKEAVTATLFVVAVSLLLFVLARKK